MNSVLGTQSILNCSQGVIALAIASVLVSPAVHAGEKTSFSKSASVQSTLGITANQSYLADRHRGSEKQIQADLFNARQDIYGKELQKKFVQEYQDINRDYEMRLKYGLVLPFQSYEQANRNRDYGRFMLRTLLDYQLQENLKKAEKRSDEIRTFNKAQQTFQKIANNSTKFEFSPDFKFGTDADLPGQRGRAWMKSNLINANFDAVFGPGFQMNPMENANKSDSVVKDDSYRIKLSRELVWGLQAGMTYGFNTTRMNHTISKAITRNLSAEVASTRGLNSGLSGMPRSEESVRMNYGLSF